MKNKLRIGILLDSYEVCAWEFSLIKKILNLDCARIEIIVVNRSSNLYSSWYDKFKKNRNKIIYYLYSKIDEMIFRRLIGKPNAFKKKSLKILIKNTLTIEVKPIQKKFSDYFETKDIAQIKKANIDIFIRLGFRILRGEILSIAKYGIWSFHHGDNKVNRGGPPGYWEVVENLPETGSIIQILSEDLDNGKVIYRSWSRTDKLSPFKNNNSNYWKTISFMPRKIEELHRVGADLFSRI